MALNKFNRTNTLNVKSLFRDFKLRVISDDIKFNIDVSKFAHFRTTDQYKLFKDHFPNEIITGSTSLWLYGLLNRNLGDLDVEVENYKDIKNILKKDEYSDDIKNYIGYKRFQLTEHIGGMLNIKNLFGKAPSYVDVDIFKPSGCNYNIYSGIKIASPLDVIGFKIDLINNNSSPNKHLLDLDGIFEL